MLAFGAGIAAVGVAHQTAWLTTSPEPLTASSWKHGCEASAIGSLKTLVTTQSVFREGDMENDGKLDHGTLDELGRAGSIDEVLAAGQKMRYRFEVCPSVTTPELLWFATAFPVSQEGGSRWFFANQAGVIFYTTSGAFRVDVSLALTFVAMTSA